MQSTAFTQGGSSVHKLSSKKGDSLSPEREYNGTSGITLNRGNYASIGARSMAGNTRVSSSKNPRNNLLANRSNSKQVIGANQNAYGMNMVRGANQAQNANLKRPKSSGNYSKKMKYKQWGQQASMRSNNQLDFNNYNSQSRTNINTSNVSGHGLRHPLILSKEISEASIQVGS